MNSEVENTNNTKMQPSGLGMKGAALAHALNLLSSAGYLNTITDTSAGVTITVAGIRTTTGANGKLAFTVAEVSDGVPA